MSYPMVSNNNVYIFQPDAGEPPFVFTDEDDAVAFAEARGATALDVDECPIIDRARAAAMIADELSYRAG